MPSCVAPWQALTASALLALSFLGCAHGGLVAAELGRPSVFADSVRYDGTRVSLRLLVTAVEGPIAVDRRMVENVHLTIAGVSACDGRPVSYVVEDYFPPELSVDDVLRIEPGYWYGATLEYTLFKAPGPDCVLAKYVFWTGLPGAKREPSFILKVERK